MTITPPRRALPLFPTRSHPGGRSAMTCHYRCGDACFQDVPNTSDNTYFGDVVTEGLRRRTMLQAGGVAVAAAGLTAWARPAAAKAPPWAPRDGVGFTPIAPTPADVDAVVVPTGYRWSPIISWGDPIHPSAPAFDFDNQSVEAQQMQAGYNSDYVTVLRGGAGNNGQSKGVLVFNNEYTNDQLMFRGVEDSEDLSEEQLRIIMAAHGMTVVEVKRKGSKGAWRYLQDGARNRRVHTYSELVLDGPAAGDPALRTSA
ncbi:MAG: PhoX family protein, partial [Ornithinimicrobium sp.]|uniref:PhoX family protein n=1 Tax=Ornithinimicrobium sp. TaxID=1977084 RepID=UPI003D9BB66E